MRGQTRKTNSQAFANESWLMRSPVYWYLGYLSDPPPPFFYWDPLLFGTGKYEGKGSNIPDLRFL